MNLLQCIDVNKTFGNKKVLENINLTISKGKIIGLLGKNGTGKSTLIKLINDLLTATSGKILINGKKVGVDSKKIISYLPERTYLDKSMTVDKTIEYFEDFYDNFLEISPNVLNEKFQYKKANYENTFISKPKK